MTITATSSNSSYGPRISALEGNRDHLELQGTTNAFTLACIQGRRTRSPKMMDQCNRY